MAVSTKIKAAYQLIRFELAFAAGVCVVLGGIIGSGSLIPTPTVLAGFLCGFFISGSANILNDYYDFEVDKRNAPNRPLPSGIVSRAEVIIYSIAVALIGLISAWLISLEVFIFCLLLWLLSFAYNWKLKEFGILGNIVVATAVASTFILGAIVSGTTWNTNVGLLSLIAFFVDLGEEVAGDAMDMEGDKIRKTKSIAILFGRKVALRLSMFFFTIVVIISLIPLFRNQIGIGLALILIAVDLAILAFAYKLLTSQSRAKGLQFMRAIYTIAYLGLAVLYVFAFTG